MEETARNTIDLKPGATGDNNQSQDLADDSFDEQKIRLNLELFKNQQKVGIVGGLLSYLSFKNSTSFAIGTYQNGLVVVENGEEIYSAELQQDVKDMNNIIYIEHLDCYLIYCYENVVYRKDIDDKPPYLYFAVDLKLIAGKPWIYSKAIQRLIASESLRNIVFIDLDKRRIDFEIRNKNLGKLVDLRVFGEKGNMLISIAKGGRINLFCLNFELRKICAQRSYIFINPFKRKEMFTAIAVCEKNKYLLASTKYEKFVKASRIIIFEIKGLLLTKKVVLDLSDLNQAFLSLFEFFGYVGSHVLWVGLSGRNRETYLYDLDMEKEELRELEDKRVNHRQRSVIRICRLGNNLYFTGREGHIMKVSLSS